MPWLTDTIEKVKKDCSFSAEVKKQEVQEENTRQKLESFQEHSVFPSDEEIDEWMESYQKVIDTYTILDILIDNGLTTREEFSEKRKEFEADLRREVKNEIMNELEANNK